MPLNLLVTTKIVGQQINNFPAQLEDIVCLEENVADISLFDHFNRIVACQFDKYDTIVLPPEFVNQPVTCKLA